MTETSAIRELRSAKAAMDAMLKSLWPATQEGDQGAIDRVLKIMDKRAAIQAQLELKSKSQPAAQIAAPAAPALPGMEGALNALDEAQLRSAAARAVFEIADDASPWMNDYWELLAEGWAWRQAVLMLWEAQPARARTPKTQIELAVNVLGLTSDRVISGWRQDNPAMAARIARLTVSAVGKARAEVIAALVEAASDPNPRSHADRKMVLEMTGDYVPKARVGVGSLQDLEEASTEDLMALAQLPGTVSNDTTDE